MMQRKESVNMGTPETTEEVKDEQWKYQYGFWVIIAGFVLVAGVFVAAIMKWAKAADVTMAVGSITGFVGTAVGAYFGFNAGSAGKGKAESRASKAEERVMHLAGMLEPAVAKGILEKI
jgi:hypothetical protein